MNDGSHQALLQAISDQAKVLALSDELGVWLILIDRQTNNLPFIEETIPHALLLRGCPTFWILERQTEFKISRLRTALEVASSLRALR